MSESDRSGQGDAPDGAATSPLLPPPATATPTSSTPPQADSPQGEAVVDPQLPQAPAVPQPAKVPPLPETGRLVDYVPFGGHAPPPPPETHRSTEPTVNRTIARGRVARLTPWSIAAQIGLAGTAASAGLFGYAIYADRSALVDRRDGGAVTAQRLQDLDDLESIAAIALTVSWIVCAVLFVAWFYRAYRNLANYRRVDFRTGWTIGGWLIPILNLWRPYQIAAELGAKSPAQRRDQPPGMIPTWWISYLLGIFASQLAAGLDTGSVDAAIRSDTLWLAVAALWLIAAISAIRMVQHVDDAQRPFATTSPT